jgi:hypothetical protein
MSDWIDGMKTRDEERVESQRRADELRLHKARIIRARAPVLWAAVIEQIEDDLEKLKTAFPDDASRHGELSRDGDSISVRASLSGSSLHLALNLDGQCIDVWKTIAQRVFQKPSLKPCESIPVRVDHNEIVAIVRDNCYYANPAFISEAIIRAALGFK